MYGLGINIGSSSLKIVLLEKNEIIQKIAIPHDGNFLATIKRVLPNFRIPPGTKAMVTGTEGRYLLNMSNVIEPLCIEEGLKKLDYTVNAVVSLGGEDLVVYTLNHKKKIINNFSGNKCASGTGEFLKQQLARMEMTLQDINKIPETARILPISTRCSVFMKSDCTHKLNKKEATKNDIVLSLTNIMAGKVIDFLKKAKIKKGKVLLVGGVTKNRHIIRFIRERAAGIDFIVPDEAAYFEAYGAACMAEKIGKPMPVLEKLFKFDQVKFESYSDIQKYREKVVYFSTEITRVKEGEEYILGIDGGSTTTKACLMNIKDNSIAAFHYGRTHGDPVKALKKCILEIQKKIKTDTGSSSKIKISLSATTGSSREILGVFIETPAVYNEIIAHSEGTSYFNKDVDTIFEIGGQDAKYVLLKNGVPIDYAMNEACSAGTGSFLEESAEGDLNINQAHEIGDIALNSTSPLRFGEHCSAFINSDIRKAIQQGASKEDITAGIVTSIVSNYLNRVVGNRTIGKKIFLQGGVAKNKAVPLAFAMLLNKEILVPPRPELMGAFGVALLAKQKLKNKVIEKKEIELDKIIDTEIKYEREFKCKACENFCIISVLNVNGHKYMFGGRCNKYANSRKKIDLTENKIVDYVKQRMDLMFQECSPPEAEFKKKHDFTIGIPLCFSVYSLYPLYSWFFHSLGIKTFLSEEIHEEGVARTESAYCFPAEIAHGAVFDCIKKEADYILLPHFRDMPSYEDSVHANFCPITQGLPYYIHKAFPEISEKKILPLIVSFKFGREKTLEFFIKMGSQIGIKEENVRWAFDIAYKKQNDYLKKAGKLGLKALEESKESGRAVVALFGRPYNAFTKDANMGIPGKFTSRGHSIIPFDILPFEKEAIFDNMYWYYGQQNMKAASMLRDIDNIYITYVTNFSCAPDSFLLHYIKWIMGTKPFLILELDSHSADAGIDTRVEAFLDIIEGYRQKSGEIKKERYDNGLRFINNGQQELHVLNTFTGEKIPFKNNKRVKILLANMGELSTEISGTILRTYGFNAEVLPVSNFETLQLARSHASGKECMPSHLVLGSTLQFLASKKYKKEEIYLLFVPITTGPCRTGQYCIFYENLFRDMKLDNVIVVTLSADNSYNELGDGFSKQAWWGFVIADYMKDIQTSLAACAANPGEALTKYKLIWHKMLKTAGKDIKKILPQLKQAAYEISRIPLKRKLKSTPKVLVVGEIYVRRDDFAITEIIDHFSKKGIIAKVSGVAEWIHYTDFVQKYDLKKRLKMIPLYKRFFSRPFFQLIRLGLETIYKHSVEHHIKKALKKSRLIPDTPHNMKKIMKNTEKYFVNHELNSEIAISSGIAATAMQENYSGIVNISPFACLIGRVIEGLFTPWARDKNYPVISIEIDGNILPPNIINKLNIFTLNVLRYKKNPKLAELVEND